MNIVYQAISNVGTVRRINQDNFYVNGMIKNIDADNVFCSSEFDQQYHMMAVCDGMGGEEEGEMAAYLAVDCLRRFDSASFENRWMDYIEEANERICQYQLSNSIKMGTTFAGIFLNSSRVLCINIGDSRIYRIRRNRIWQISKDHNQYQMMLDAGLKPDKQIIRKSKNRLTQCLGIPSDRFIIKPYSIHIDDILPGDIYVLCSDGVHGVLSDAQIINEIKHAKKSTAESLVRRAELAGSRDNMTAVVAYVKETDRRETMKDKMAKVLFFQKSKDYIANQY